MPRYRLTIEYDGTNFCGWQHQINGISVQEVLEKAVYNFTREKTSCIASGRTDSGVHALGQVVHFNLTKEMETETIMGALNYHVRPYKIAIIDVVAVDEKFHARYSCLWRSYKYRILNRLGPSAIMHGYVWHIKQLLDCNAMHDAAQVLLGKHDFSSFRSARCQSKTAVKSIDTISVSNLGDGILEMYISAPSFMHNQVRIITGCLVKVGLGQWSKDDLLHLLNVKDRTLAAQTAPAHGLYFYKAGY